MTDKTNDFVAPFLSNSGREDFAARVRGMLGLDLSERLPPISQVITLARERIPQCRGLEIVVRSDDDMREADAIAIRGDIIVGQTTYLDILADLPHARGTIVHELVHTIDHPSDLAKYRMAGGTGNLSFIDRANSGEAQADSVMRAILMPPAMVRAARHVAQLAKIARITQAEAAKRWTEFFADEKDRLWNELPMIDGESSRVSRQCGKFRILWAEYCKTTQCAWFIENGRVVASIDRLQR